MSAERLSDPRLRAVPRTVAVRAVLLGGRLDTRSFEREGTIATTPLTVRLERGFALLFRYGVVVLVDVPQEAAQKLLADLTPRERMVFELRHYQGMRLRAIGDMLGTSEEAAKNCLFRATQKMRIALGDFV